MSSRWKSLSTVTGLRVGKEQLAWLSVPSTLHYGCTFRELRWNHQWICSAPYFPIADFSDHIFYLVSSSSDTQVTTRSLLLCSENMLFPNLISPLPMPFIDATSTNIPTPTSQFRARNLSVLFTPILSLEQLVAWAMVIPQDITYKIKREI